MAGNSVSIYYCYCQRDGASGVADTEPGIGNRKLSQPAGVLIALDRQEKGQSELSAIQEVEREYNIPVISIVNLTQVLCFMKDDASLSHFAEAVENYRSQYGIAN